MEDEPSPEFERDAYIERLINLRRTDPVGFQVLPQDVRKIVEEYEYEKEDAERKAGTARETTA